MTPTEYFPKTFLEDVERFKNSLICGATLSQLKNKSSEWPHLEHFLICEYELNLLDQAIYSYFQSDHDRWKSLSVHQIDARCASYHGGISHPIHILSYAERNLPEFHLEEKITADLLYEYDKMFWKYLKDICKQEKFEQLSPEALKEKLLQDPDNSTISVKNYLNSKVGRY